MIDPRSREAFCEYLDHDLKCVLGNGRLESIAAYKILDM